MRRRQCGFVHSLARDLASAFDSAKLLPAIIPALSRPLMRVSITREHVATAASRRDSCRRRPVAYFYNTSYTAPSGIDVGD